MQNKKSKKLVPILCAASLLSLSGCQTVNYYKNKVFSALSLETLFSIVDYVPGNHNANDRTAGADRLKKPRGPIPCPNVTIMNDLKQMHQFTNLAKANASNKISSIYIIGSENKCHFELNDVVVDIDVNFEGDIGPKARIFENDKPNFAYPYFIAVTDKNNKIISKDIFAVSLSYGKTEDFITHTEQLRQVIKLNSKFNAPDYSVLIGFQLDGDSLAYNRDIETGKQAFAAKTKDQVEVKIPEPDYSNPISYKH